MPCGHEAAPVGVSLSAENAGLNTSPAAEIAAVAELIVASMRAGN
jgi:hypothetical protein